MASNTPNLGLRKPNPEIDNVEYQLDLNQNWDYIDDEFGDDGGLTLITTGSDFTFRACRIDNFVHFDLVFTTYPSTFYVANGTYVAFNLDPLMYVDPSIAPSVPYLGIGREMDSPYAILGIIIDTDGSINLRGAITKRQSSEMGDNLAFSGSYFRFRRGT